MWRERSAWHNGPMRRPTDAEKALIIPAIHVGAMPHVAAEVAGVDNDLFRSWMLSLEPDLMEFQREVHKAHAIARMDAESRVKREKPLQWLTKGPGRTAPGREGWGDRLELTGADGGAVQVATVAEALDYKRLSTVELEELDALEIRREQLLAKARVTPAAGGVGAP